MHTHAQTPLKQTIQMNAKRFASVKQNKTKRQKNRASKQSFEDRILRALA